MSTGRWEFDRDGNVRFVDEAGSPAQEPATDGSYRYSYRKASDGSYQSYRTSDSGPLQRQSKKSDSGWHWVLIVLGFMAFWPVGLILLFAELSGRWPGSDKANREFNRMAAAAKNAAAQFKNETRNAAQQARDAAEPATQAAGNYGQTTSQVQERLSREKAQRDRDRDEIGRAIWEEEQRRKAAKSQRKSERARQKAAKRAQSDAGLTYGLGHVRLFRWIGGIMAGLFGFALVTELIDDLTYSMGLGYTLRETVPLLALALIGVTLLVVAGTRKRKFKKFQKYLSMIGDRETIPIAPLAGAMGVSEKHAEKDLQEMLERDFWPEGYVDAARQVLVLGNPLDTAPEPVTDQEAVDTDDQTAQTLRHIRQVNDAIADVEMSNKIYRIEELTGKIFQFLEERPEKAGELRSFMNYYLPQTLKILETYSKMEAQGVEGENIAETKAKIEGMMDKLVDGYETQLDKLFADDALDISADLKVMEQMLEKDGLAVENELNF